MDIHTSIISQYGAGLQMLRSAIEACPDELWFGGRYKNSFAHVAYHVLFYTHFYLSRREEEFVPWEKGIRGAHFMGDSEWTPEDHPARGVEYSKSDLLEYQTLVAGIVADAVNNAPMDASSGFEWLPFDRFETHLYNIRHLQHHTGQLVERVRTETGMGVDWVGLSR